MLAHNRFELVAVGKQLATTALMAVLAGSLMACSGGTAKNTPAETGEIGSQAAESSASKKDAAHSDNSDKTDITDTQEAKDASAEGSNTTTKTVSTEVYANKKYGFTFDPSFCKDLNKLDETETSVHFNSKNWEMDLVVQAKENTANLKASAVADAYTKSADSSLEPDVLVDEDDNVSYCLVVQAEKDKDDQTIVAVYISYVGSGSIQGLRASFPAKKYANLSEGQAQQLIASFVPGDLKTRH
ncbi:hypothetical protein [uncultured Olegusella sp.]|uniref:hypothetical protein n=1 Tax=uncultured Olegusella sp. TaxID=1979846 RepID=UPI00263325AC|nr:hypothetical protein [uncultured Olegusella sp.]